MQQRALRWLNYIFYAAAAVGGVYLSFRYLLPWLSPFLVAFAAAAALEGGVRFLIKHRWKRPAASGLLTLIALGAIVWAVSALSSRLVAFAADFSSQVPELIASVSRMLTALEDRVLAYAASAPEDVAGQLKNALDSAALSLYGLPATVSQWALDAVTGIAQRSPDMLLFIVTAGIGTYFISASFPRTVAFISAQMPESWRQKLEGLGKDLTVSFGGFIRAQLILMVMTFFELSAAFFLLGIDGALGIAAVTALVDALPVFGSGIVLLPWAAFCLLQGVIGQGVGLIICWAVVTLVRSCVQAKLLGDQIGLDPLASLLAIYVGWKVWHIWGMLLFPILFVTLRQLNDKGVVRLWRRV